MTAFVLISCDDDDDDNTIPSQVTSFRITLSNVANYLQAKSFGDAALTNTGDAFVTTFQATPGTYLSFANMFAQSNDWFFATNGAGIKLWDGTTPKTGDISAYLKVYDAGSEEDEEFLTDFSNTVYTAPNQTVSNSGPADDDSNVRDTGRNITNYLTANLSYDTESRTFTLTVTKADREGLHNPGYVTPGIFVIHTQPNPIFEEGTPLRNNGLESLAEDGSPQQLYDWFHETGSDGAPLRLSSSHSPFSPGIAYTFSSEKDPFFTQGEAVKPNSGLEELSEDGNISVALEYLTNDGINAVASHETAPVLPGESLTFSLDATPGDKLGFSTMFVQSNDWFIAFNNNGIELFNTDGTPKSGTDYSIQAYLYDAGTETDEPVGFGAYQAPRQSQANTGTADSNSLIRRVGALEDVQFGKGTITSGPGVVALNDPRGGYNLIVVNIEPVN